MSVFGYSACLRVATPIRRWTTTAVLAIAVALPVAAAQAVQPQAVGSQTQPGAISGLGSDWVAVAPSRLAQMRGGYELPSGLVLSFSIERVVFVNGELVASSRISITDPSQMTTEQATDLAKLNDTLLVQVGKGNSFQAGGVGGVVIQNTLDNQDIRAMTGVDVSVGTLGLLQDLNANAALQQGIINAVTGP